MLPGDWLQGFSTPLLTVEFCPLLLIGFCHGLTSTSPELLPVAVVSALACLFVYSDSHVNSSFRDMAAVRVSREACVNGGRMRKMGI